MDRRGSRLSRREFVVSAGAAGLGLVAGCARLPWQSPAPPKMHQVGVLVAAPSANREYFWQGLRDLGYVEGSNIALLYRDAAGQPNRLPDLAAELVRLPVEVIVTQGQTATTAAKQATSSIPIVQLGGGGNLVAAGLIASLAHPGGNVTGLSSLAPELTGKRLQLLKEALRDLSRVAVLWDAALDREGLVWTELQNAARTLSLELQSLTIQGPDDLDDAFGVAVQEHAGALLVVTDPTTHAQPQRVVDLAARSRLPAMYFAREFVLIGGLMAYAPDERPQYRRAATYVDKILKGANPADLPVEQPMTFEFLINMKMARELGVTFPNEIML
jgi:putative tryptophan/tyrosine transport system substrate-binding protein